MTRLYHRVYLAGYSGWIMPPPLRRVIARSQVHRAWLNGCDGCFVRRARIMTQQIPIQTNQLNRWPAFSIEPVVNVDSTGGGTRLGPFLIFIVASLP